MLRNRAPRSGDWATYRPPNDGGDGDTRLTDLIDRIRIALPQWGGEGGAGFAGGILALLIFVIALLIWLSTGIYTVGANQEGVLRTFGRFTGTASEGLHWHWPSPIGVRNVESVTETRRLEIGFRSGASGFGSQQSDVSSESTMITGDENIVIVHAVVQYTISNLPDFLFNIADPGDSARNIPKGHPDGLTLRDVADSALREVVGRHSIDDVLTTGKEQIQTETRLIMQQTLDSYHAGIHVSQVLLQNVNPPTQVQSAFEDVVRAREDMNTQINQAEAYAAGQLPKAQGQAQQIIQQAQGFKDGLISKAQGDAAGFDQLLQAYQTSKSTTRERLYLETMEQVLPGVKKIIMPSGAGNNILSLLPLNLATGGTTSSTSSATSTTATSTLGGTG